jgi:hypothetical protein
MRPSEMPERFEVPVIQADIQVSFGLDVELADGIANAGKLAYSDATLCKGLLRTQC